MAEFLFVTWDGGGNNVPAVAIAQELRERAHGVRFLGQRSQSDAMASAGLPFAPYPRLGDFRVTQSAASLMRLVASRAMRHDVVDELAARPADVVVVDCILFGAMASLRRSGHGYTVLEHTMDGFLRGRLRHVDPFLRFGGYRASALLDGGSVTLTASLRELDHGHGQVEHLGPMVRGVPAHPDAPAVLVSLSTYAYRGMAHVFQHVLDALGELPIRVIATTGPSLDPAALHVPDNVEMHGWLRHADAMPHVSAVVGHGGHGTAMASLAHGLPLLALPLDANTDQRWIGRAVQDAGAGLTLPPRASAERIRGAVLRLLSDEGIRAAAARLGERARSMGGAARGADLLEAAVADSV